MNLGPQHKSLESSEEEVSTLPFSVCGELHFPRKWLIEIGENLVA